MTVEFDDEIGDALRATADTFQPDDPGRLVGEGYLRGRRMRRRRTAAVVTGAAAFAAVAVGGVLAGTSAGGGDHPSGVAAAPRLSMEATAHATPVMSDKQVVAVLTSLLPEGKVSSTSGRGTQDGYPLAEAVLDTGSGPGLVEVGLQRHGQKIDGCPSATANPGIWCQISKVKGGGTLMLFKGWEYPDHRRDLKDWTATYVTPNGSMVELSQWNSRQEKDSPVTGTNPPLTVAQMAAIVTDAAWQPVLRALPDSPAYVPGKDAWGSGKVPPSKADALKQKETPRSTG